MHYECLQEEYILGAEKLTPANIPGTYKNIIYKLDFR